jgi:hypothetical protein
VTSRVTLKEKSGEVVGRYWNTKVFAQGKPNWQCIAWQVATIEQQLEIETRHV